MVNKGMVQLFEIADLARVDHLQPVDWSDIKPSMMSYCINPFCTPVKIEHQSKILGIGCIIRHKYSAWIAHVIVDASHRGQGLGRQLIQYLQQMAKEQNIGSIQLIATEMGAPLYKACGFKDTGDYTFLSKSNQFLRKALAKELVPAGEKHVEQILALDRSITGEDRKELIVNFSHSAIIFQTSNTVEGFYLPTLKEGPVYATTERAGYELLKLKCTIADSIALPNENTLGIEFLLNSGFSKVEKTAKRMSFGETIHSQQHQIYSRIGGNYG